MTLLRTMLATGGGATVNEWTQYTPVFSTPGGGALGNGTIFGMYRRVGDSIQLVVRISFGSTSTFGTGSGDNFQISIPSGLTRDSTKILSSTARVPSNAYLLDASTPANNVTGGIISIGGGSTQMSMLGPGSATPICSTVPFTWATGDVINIDAELPVAEYAGGIGNTATISPTALSGDVNDYNPSGLSTANYVRIDGGAADRNITGLTAPASGSSIVTLVNIGTTNNLVLKHQSGSSSATNRFLNGGGTDITLTPGSLAACWYDTTTTRWRVGGAGGGGGGYTIETISTTSTVSATNRVVSITAGGITVSLPASPSSGDYLLLKDTNGNATSSNIIIAGNGHNIDGSSSFTLTTSYSAIYVVYNGSTTTWMIL